MKNMKKSVNHIQDLTRIEKCSSCGGRGYKICTNCRNGYKTCSTCNGSGKITCNICKGKGENTCPICIGYRTLDHYFILQTDFVILNKTILLSNFSAGFNYKKALELGMNIRQVIYIKHANMLQEKEFDDIRFHSLYNIASEFFNYSNDSNKHLKSSRISCYKNEYVEFNYKLNGECYKLFSDENIEHYFHEGQAPSDNYEMDLLKNLIDYSTANELFKSRKTIEQISNYDFFDIDEEELLKAIDDTSAMYNAYEEVKKGHFRKTEKILTTISQEKEKEPDFIKLRKKLQKTYNYNTLILGAIGLLGLSINLYNKSGVFITLNIMIFIILLLISLFQNKKQKSIVFSRIFILVLLMFQFGFIEYKEHTKGNDIKSEKQLKDEFKIFKMSHIVYPLVDDSHITTEIDTLIIIELTGNERNAFNLPKGAMYKAYEYYDMNGYGMGDYKTRKNLVKRRIQIDETEYNRIKNYNRFFSLREVFGDTRIELKPKDIIVEEEIEVMYMKNQLFHYEHNHIWKMFINKKKYEEFLSELQTK